MVYMHVGCYGAAPCMQYTLFIATIIKPFRCIALND